jgi:hypothetical protein
MYRRKVSDAVEDLRASTVTEHARRGTGYRVIGSRRSSQGRIVPFNESEEIERRARSLVDVLSDIS